jgi:hypothetical protein
MSSRPRPITRLMLTIACLHPNRFYFHIHLYRSRYSCQVRILHSLGSARIAPHPALVLPKLLPRESPCRHVAGTDTKVTDSFAALFAEESHVLSILGPKDRYA